MNTTPAQPRSTYDAERHRFLEHFPKGHCLLRHPGLDAPGHLLRSRHAVTHLHCGGASPCPNDCVPCETALVDDPRTCALAGASSGQLAACGSSRNGLSERSPVRFPAAASGSPSILRRNRSDGFVGQCRDD